LPWLFKGSSDWQKLTKKLNEVILKSADFKFSIDTLPTVSESERIVNIGQQTKAYGLLFETFSKLIDTQSQLFLLRVKSLIGNDAGSLCLSLTPMSQTFV